MNVQYADLGTESEDSQKSCNIKVLHIRTECKKIKRPKSINNMPRNKNVSRNQGKGININKKPKPNCDSKSLVYLYGVRKII